MTTNLDTIKATLSNIANGGSMLDILVEFERTLDNAEIFAYKNWILGEIVDGPHVSRYWVKLTLMYPYTKMPDPEAGLRLTKLGAKVSFSKSIFKKPVKVHGPQDWADSQSKEAKMADHEIWLVTIDMPRKYITRGITMNDEVIAQDVEDTNAELADSFEEAAPAEDMGGEDEISMDMGDDEEDGEMQ